MQCFGGCLAPGGYEKQQDTPTTVYKRSASSGSGWPRTEGPEVQILQPSISCNLDESSVSASAHADIKAKIQLHSRSSKRSGSFISQDSNCSNRNSSSSRQDLEHLRQQYLMQHGRNIMSVSTLQQDGLHHFVMPGECCTCFLMKDRQIPILVHNKSWMPSDSPCQWDGLGRRHKVLLTN